MSAVPALAPATTPRVSAPVQPRAQVVSFGDTLGAIARRNNVSVQSLLAANPQIKDANRIQAGSVIRLPDVAAGKTFTVGSTNAAATGFVRRTPAQGIPVVAQPAASASPVDRMIDQVARVEGRGRYDAWNASDNGRGVSFGIIQFNQKTGHLPALLREMNAQHPGKFRAYFGPHADNLLDERWVRTANLNTPELKQRMQRAAQDPDMQAVQRSVARREYLDPVVKLASSKGITSERAVALLFDSAVQNGPTATRAMFTRVMATSPSQEEFCQRFAHLADANRFADGRRGKLLQSPHFSSEPLQLAAATPRDEVPELLAREPRAMKLAI
ncbi:MAG: LysM peptidoglycan-binding domain-containing protein [Myxococcota bacterium]